MAASGFRGTSVEQDGRWGKAEEKLMAEMAKKGKFAPILDTKINLKKINIDVMTKWITQKIIQIVKVEDDVLINMVINILQGGEVEGRKMQVLLTPFFDKETPKFMEELWNLLADAQAQSSGIPTQFIEQKKQEILARTSNRDEIKTIRPNLDGHKPIPSTPTRSGSPPGRISSRLNTSPPSIRSLRAPEEDKKRAESRSARIHRPREAAPVEHREDEMDRQRARSRRHGLEERSQSTKKRPLEEEKEEEKPRQRYPSRHHDRDRRERSDAVRVRRSPPRDI